MPRWPARTLEERFWEKVERRSRDECWPWKAGKNADGYGLFNGGDAGTKAHRIAYSLEVAKPPKGHDVHHRCERRDCCNPRHMEVLTTHEHGILSSSNVSRRTSCKNGHLYSDHVSIIYRKGRPIRRCRICDAASTRRYMAKKKAAQLLRPVT